MLPLLNHRYRVLQELADGGFGKTFLAEDTQMPSSRKCVIKQLKPIAASEGIQQLVQERFQREAALLEALGEGHNQIPKLYAYFTENEQFYLVEEWVQGQTLTQKIAQEGKLPEALVHELLVSLLHILEYIEAKGIIHRDIKPDNIILRFSDQKPVLIDFGAVKETVGTMITPSGNPDRSIVVGTPGFMSSEQSIGRPVFSSDIYSLGLTAIYLFTGKYPSELDNNPRTGEIEWRSFAPATLSPGFAAVLDRSIQSHARDRYVNARAMLDDLQAIAAPAIPPTQPMQPAYSPAAVPPATPPGYAAPPAVPYYAAPPSPSPSGPQVDQYQGVSAPPYWQSATPGIGGGGTFNTATPVPPEILGWNWGAFLLPNFWLFPNKVWIGLLSWIPCVGIVMMFVLGAKGNAWAWRSRQWQNMQAFKAHQRAWAIAGGAVYGSLTGLVVLLGVIGSLVPPADENITSSEGEVAPLAEGKLDGYWDLNFKFGDTPYEGTLYMGGNEGALYVTYFDHNAKRDVTIEQSMVLSEAPGGGIYIEGANPVDIDTKKPFNYDPDRLTFKLEDNELSVQNCDSTNTCVEVEAQYLGLNIEN